MYEHFILWPSFDFYHEDGNDIVEGHIQSNILLTLYHTTSLWQQRMYYSFTIKHKEGDHWDTR